MSADLFARVLATFRGERHPVDELVARTLRLVLDPVAVDLSISPESLCIRQWRYPEVEYPLDAAPGVLSFLLERVGSVGPRSIKSWIAPTRLGTGELTAWTAPARHVLAEAWPSRVLVRIREYEADLEDELPTRPVRRLARW